MLAPLTALGLAGTTFEIIHLDIRLTSTVRDAHAAGFEKHVNDLKLLVLDIRTSVSRLASIIADDTADGQTTSEKRTLTAHCSRCKDTGTDVKQHLDEVRPTLRKFDPRVKEIVHIEENIDVDHEAITKYLEELRSLRDAVAFCTVESLRQSTTSDFATTSLDHERLQFGLSTIVRLLQNGGRALTRDDFKEDSLVQQCMEVSIQSRLDSRHSLVMEPTSVALGVTMVRRRTIMNLLNFRQMLDRIDEVDLAYTKTFEWIFRDQEYSLAWSSFPDFLKSETQFAYWINGKAGSGKSTLLYFLIRHERLADYLRTWSGTRRLTLAHFFSWNLGSALQNSEMGLLQSLLYQVLAEDESLVHQVFPELWHDIDPLQPPKLESLSLTEVKRALKRLLDVSAGRRCFCFFVDGIDEFNGDYNSIIDLLLAFEVPDLKFVLSSRPVDVCLDRFAHLPQLRLQDLTAGDIEIYIDERLSSKYEMSDLMRDEPEAAVELVHELKDRASGVFLWIKLVVTSLLDGLKKGDDVADLKIRLRALPPDLKDLFASMLGKMEAGYQKQAAVLFRLVRTASLLLDGGGMPTQFLAVASRDFQSVSNRRPIAFDTDKIVAWCKYVERRLRSRCCGLVEIHESSYRPDWWRTDLEKLDKSDQSLLASHVQFLHRTVAEYLYQDEVWDKVVCKSSKNTDFEPHKNLAYAALHMMKISPLADDLPTMQAYSWAKVLVRAVSDYECNRGKALEDLVDEMDLVLRHHTSTSSQSSHWSSYIDLDSARNIVHGHLVVLRQPLSSLLSFAAFVGLGIYVDSKLERHGLQFGAGTSVQKIMLQTLFSRSSDWVKITWTDRVDVVCSMLEHGANPNETFEGPSLWQCCLQQLLALNCSETSSASQVTHRKRDRRRISSTPGLPRSADSPCTCSPADFRDWSQLIMACLHAGGRLADIDYLKPCAQADPGSSVCYFRQLCQHLYGANNESRRPQPLLGLPTPLSRSVLTMHERDQGSTYGQISLSGSATALLGNEYTWGDKITHVHHNYFGGVLTSNEVSHQVQHSAENAGETRTKQDLTSRPENDFTTILAQFQSDVVAVLQASPLGSPDSENPAFREADITENDRLMVSASHWRGCQPTTFSDRQCTNPSCITSTTIGWDYVPLLKGLLCLDCYECWRATGQLRAETRGRELVLSAEDLFEQSFTNTLQLTTTCDSDDSEEELFDAPTPSTRYVVPSSVDSDTSEVFATPQSININFTRSAPSSQPGFHDTTSGTPHCLRSYNGR